MSKYKTIQTEYRNPESLLIALRQLEYQPEIGSTMQSNDLVVWNDYGHSNQTASIVIPKEQIYSKVGPVYGALGFFWNGTGYDLVADDLDQYRGEVQDMHKKIKQAYAAQEIRRVARIKGYTVREERMGDGSIRFVCSQR